MYESWERRDGCVDYAGRFSTTATGCREGRCRPAVLFIRPEPPKPQDCRCLCGDVHPYIPHSPKPKKSADDRTREALDEIIRFFNHASQTAMSDATLLKVQRILRGED